MSFTTPLVTTEIENPGSSKRLFELDGPFTYYTYLVPSFDKFYITVPEDFITDFASVPTFLHWLISPFGKHNKADVIHDHIYQQLKLQYLDDLKECQNDTDFLICNQRLTDNRAMCDAIYREAKNVLKVNKLKREVLQLGVTQFGGIALFLGDDKRG